MRPPIEGASSLAARRARGGAAVRRLGAPDSGTASTSAGMASAGAGGSEGGGGAADTPGSAGGAGRAEAAAAATAGAKGCARATSSKAAARLWSCRIEVSCAIPSAPTPVGPTSAVRLPRTSSPEDRESPPFAGSRLDLLSGFPGCRPARPASGRAILGHPSAHCGADCRPMGRNGDRFPCFPLENCSAGRRSQLQPIYRSLDFS